MPTVKQYAGIALSVAGAGGAVAGYAVESLPEDIRFGLILGGVVAFVMAGELWQGPLTSRWKYDERQNRIRHLSGFHAWLTTFALLMGLSLTTNVTETTFEPSALVTSVLGVSGGAFLLWNTWYKWSL